MTKSSDATRPLANRSKTCYFKCSPKTQPDSVSRSVSGDLTRYRLLRNLDTSRNAAGFLQPERAARPAGSSKPWQPTGREECTTAAAFGPLHVLRDHPAAGMHAPAARSSTTIPVRPGTLKCSSTYLSCRVQADNWSLAPRNVRGKCFVLVILYIKMSGEINTC